MGWKADGKVALAVAGLGLVGRELLARSGEADLRGQVVLITGGSRGLGYLLAREFAREGCRLVICARDEQELERARADLERQGADLLGLINRLLPTEAGQASARGLEIQQRLHSSLLDRITGWGLSAARRFHEYPGPVEASARRPAVMPR